MLEAKVPYFLFQEAKTDHNLGTKFYAVAAILAFDADHNFCNGITFHRYGKIGTQGSIRAFRFNSVFEVIKDTSAQIITKSGRGYRFNTASIQYIALANSNSFGKFMENLKNGRSAQGSTNNLFSVLSLDSLKTDKTASLYFRALSNDNVRFLCSSAAGAFASDLDLKNRKILEQELKKIEADLLAQSDFGIF